MINHRHLRTFVAIADYGSFVAAADRLGLTQSAVTMQMKALEHDLNATVFDRSRRSHKLNDLGYSLLEKAREIVLLSDDFRQISVAANELSGTIRLGAISSVSTGALPEAIVNLGIEHPNFNVKIENGYTDDLIGRVEDGKLDAAVVTEPASLNESLSFRTIVEEPLMIVAAKSNEGIVDHTVLGRFPFIRFNRHTATGRIIETQLRQMRLKVRDTMELDSIEAILEMVSRGIGVSVVPEHCVTAHYVENLDAMPFGSPAVLRKVGFVERVNHQRSSFTNALFEQLKTAEQTKDQPLSRLVR